MARAWIAALLVATSIVAAPGETPASDCGDLNGDCSVTVKDAFVLLGRALDFNHQLMCPYVEECPGARSPAGVFDCFGDPACTDPAEPYCVDHKCMECSRAEHCGDGNACDYELERCMPLCFYAPPGFEYQHSGTCGDMDDSGSITVTDALTVLRRAVGLPVELRCPTAQCTSTTSPSTTLVFGDECFEDFDCWDDYPGWHCGGSTGNECVECQNAEHCADGFVCGAYSCVPK